MNLADEMFTPPSVAELIETRLQFIYLYLDDRDHPLEPLDFLEGIGFSPEQAEAVVDGCPVAINADLTDEFALELGLQRDLLACVVCPTPEETVRFHIEQIREQVLNWPDPDDRWARLVYDLDHYLAEGGDWRALCLDLLEHSWPVPWSEILARRERGLLDDDIGLGAGMDESDDPDAEPSDDLAFIADAMRMVAMLPSDGRRRVLAALYREISAFLEDDAARD